MSISLTRSAALVGAAALAFMLSACTGSAPEPSPSSSDTAPSASPEASVAALPVPGDCLGSFVTNPITELQDTNVTDIVDCTAPNAAMVFAVLPLDSALLTDDSSADYVALQTEGNAQYDTYQRWKADACQAAELEVVGAASLEFNGKSGPEAIPQLYGRFQPDATLVTPEQWAAGHHDVVCSIYWADTDGTPFQMSFDGPLDPADLYTTAFPADLRACFSFEQWEIVSCDQPHWTEFVAIVDADAILGTDVTAQMAPDANGVMSDEDVRTVDVLCRPFVAWATGSDNKDAYGAIGHTSGTGWGSDGTSYVYCGVSIAQSKDYDSIGSLVGIGDGSPEMVPVS